MRNHIRRLREARALTQKALGDLLGVDHTTVSKWEAGGPVADRYKLALSRVFEIPVSEIFIFEEAQSA